MVGNTMTLEFKINKQTIARLDSQVVVERSQEYVYAHFIFSDDWDGLDKFILLRPLDNEGVSYKIPVEGRLNKIKIPYELVEFPGFIISAKGMDANEETIITVNDICVDILNAKISGGEDVYAVRYVTSNNNTINILRSTDELDIGIDLSFGYEDHTLNLYAHTHNEKDEHDQPIEHTELIASIQVGDDITNIESELSHIDEETGETTYRNLVLTFGDGSVRRVSIDYFFNEIRQDLQTAITNLNNRITQEVSTLNKSIEDEASARELADTNLQNDIDTINSKIPNEASANNQLADKNWVNVNGGKIDTISIDDIQQEVVNKNVNLPPYPTRTSLQVDNVVNTGDSNEPVEGGTTKFTTGGAYVLKGTIDTHIEDKNNPHSVSKAQVGLGNLTNDRQVKGLASGTTDNHIVLFGEDGYTIKDSGKTLEDVGQVDTVSINGGTPIQPDVNKNIDLPAYPTKQSLGLNNVVNTGDSATPLEGGTTKFTTGGAFVLDNKIEGEITDRKAQTVKYMTVSQVASTGIVTFTLYNINDVAIDTKTLNLNTEKIITGFALDLANKKIVATCTDATTIECNISALVDDYLNRISDINSNITAIGNLIGFEYDSQNEQWILSTDGYIKAIKDLADNNKARLDNLESAIVVSGGDTDILRNLTVEGDLNVKGSTITTDQETIQSQATLIVTNSTNAPLVDYTGVVALKGTFSEYDVNANNYIKNAFYYKNTNDEYVLDDSETYTQGRQYYVAKAEAASVYDKGEDALLLGEGIYYGGTFVFDSNYIMVTLTIHSYVPNKYYTYDSINDEYVLATGDFDPNETYYSRVSQGQHLATRVDSAYLTDKHLIEWDGNSFILIDSGKSVSDIESDISANTTLINNHKNDTNNPHQVTKTQVGLGNVDNTSDQDKPISTAQQTALDNKVDITTTVNGHALNGNVTITKGDVGLGDVDNTSDLNKPISTATQNALNKKVNFITTNNILGLTNDQLNALKCGDVVRKDENGNVHTYVVSYKEENVGICLTYVDATYLETVSYDYSNSNWVYNSTDITNLTTTLNSKEDKSNKVSSVSALSTNEQYVGAKLFYDSMVDYTSYSITNQDIEDAFTNAESVS